MTNNPRLSLFNRVHPRKSAVKLLASAFLLELDEHDLRRGADPHGRTPGPCAVAGVQAKVAQLLQSMDEFSPNAAGDQRPGKELATVGVP